MRARRRITVAAPSVGPLGIAGCVLWLRADLGVTKDGSDKVSQWDDQSGNGNSFSATGTSRPTWQATGGGYAVPVLQFDGINDGLTSAITQAQPLTMLVVGHLTSQAAKMALGAAAPAMYFGANSATNVALNVGGTQITGACDATQKSIFVATLNGGSSSVTANGSVVAAGAVGTDAVVSPAVGFVPATGFYWAGWIAEIAFFAAALSGADTSRLEDYASARYGIVVT